MCFRCFESPSLSRGPKIKEFENKLGLKCKNNHVIALNSATSALQIAYQLNSIKSGSIVWTSPLTFVATANAALNLGAKIDFVDISSDTPEYLPNKIREEVKSC